MEKIKPRLRNYSDIVALTEGVNIKDLKYDTRHGLIFNHISVADIPVNWKGTAIELPAATIVFDLAGSSVSIRDRGALDYVEKTQRIFSKLTDIIYENEGIIEKFPGDGISAHFPLFDEENASAPIKRAACAIGMIILYLIDTDQGLSIKDFRFTMTYGESTIITKFGNEKHEELISIGHAVNVAHKLEKLLKDNNCFIGLDEECYKHCKSFNKYFKFDKYKLDSSLCKKTYISECWYGVKY